MFLLYNRTLKALLFMVLTAMPCFAQSGRVDNIVLWNSQGIANIAAGAAIRVCGPTDTSVPCSTTVSIYSDVALSQPLSNPFNADINGNYYFYASPQKVTVQISSAYLSTLTFNNITVPNDSLNPVFSSLSVTGASTLSKLNNVVLVDGHTYASVTAALTALGSNPGIVDARGCLGSLDLSGVTISHAGQFIYLGPCSYTILTSLISINANGGFVGMGRNSTIITCSLNSDCIKMNAGTAVPYMNGLFVGISVLGSQIACSSSPCANAIGIHHIDSIGTLYDDLVVQNFNGSSAIGMWFDNQVLFSERVTIRKASIFNNRIGWNFTNSNTTTPANSTSFGYWRVSDVHFQIGNGQYGIFEAGVSSSQYPSLYHGQFSFDANLTETSVLPTVWAILNYAINQDNTYDINTECTICTSPGVMFYVGGTSGGASTFTGSGRVSFYDLNNSIQSGATYSIQPYYSNPTGPYNTSLTTTASTSDNVTVTGMASIGHCQFTPTNTSAATNIATVYVSAKTTNQITVTHTATSGMTFDILCFAN